MGARLTITAIMTAAAVGLGPAAGAAPREAAAPSASPRISVLRGHTTVTAEATSVMTVRLPKPFKILDGIETRVAGGGRVRGFVLTQRAENFKDAATYIAAAPGYCTTPGCGDAEKETRPGSFAMAYDGVFPPGTYRLFVIADGAPVRVEVEIDGLRGSTAITPTEPAVADVDSFRQHAISTPDGPVWMGGGFSDLGGPSRGFALLEMWGYSDDVPAPEPYAWGTCFYYEREHSNPDRAFAPTCPGSEEEEAHTYYVDVARGYVASFIAGVELPYGMGGYSIVPLTSRHGGVGLWMPLTEALPEPAS